MGPQFLALRLQVSLIVSVWPRGFLPQSCRFLQVLSPQICPKSSSLQPEFFFKLELVFLCICSLTLNTYLALIV